VLVAALRLILVHLTDESGPRCFNVAVVSSEGSKLVLVTFGGLQHARLEVVFLGGGKIRMPQQGRRDPDVLGIGDGLCGCSDIPK
jgi:hypothetical protein